MKSGILSFLQNLGKSLMLPIAVLPIAGLMLRLGQPDLLDLPVMAKSGGILFDNLPLLFAVGVAVGFSVDSAGAAALGGVVAHFTLTTALATLDPRLSMGVLAGILAGLIGGIAYNRLHTLRLPPWLAFFGGKRSVPIASAFVALALAGILSLVWPPVQNLINAIGNWMVGAGVLGAAVFGTLNRLLLAFGLHQILNTLCWFKFGTFTDPSGKLVEGDLNRFFAGDPSAGMFMTGFFPVMMFGLPAVALAIYLAADRARRREVAGLLVSLVLTAVLTGITEPLEYTFMFLAPVLYAIHALLTGLALALCELVGYKAGFTFSAGAIDLALSWGKATKPATILWIGPLFFALYFAAFYFSIIFFDLKTPGRGVADADDANEPAPVPAAGGEGDRTGELAARYAAALGGIANLAVIDNCITRLRLELRDPARADEAALRKLGAAGVVRMGGSALQVIVGSEVEFVANALKALARGGAAPAPVPAAAAVPPPAHGARWAGGTITLHAPVEGRAVELSRVPDPTFAERMAGDGVAIEPAGDVFAAPLDGTILSLPSSGHAFVIRHDSGVEALVHIGIETVGLRGEGFHILAAPGMRVAAGTPILRVDWPAVRGRIRSTLSPVLITNPTLAGPLAHLVAPGDAVEAGTPLLRATVNGSAAPDEARRHDAEIPVRLPDPHGMHARPAAKLAALAAAFPCDLALRFEGRTADLRSVGALMALGIGGPADLVVAAAGPGADQAARRIAAAIAGGLDAASATEEAAPGLAAPPTFAPSSRAIRGIPASPGIAIGPAFRFDAGRAADAVPESGAGVAEELARSRTARAAATSSLETLAGGMEGRGEAATAQIFRAHQALLADEALVAAAEDAIRAGKSAAFAWRAACDGAALALARSGSDRLAARAADYRDLADRLLATLLPEAAAAPPAFPDAPFILVARDLTPSATAALPRERVLALVTAEGGPTAHTAILARAMDLPAVVAAGEAALALPDGAGLVVNGVAGFVEPSPDADILARARAAADALAQRRRLQAAAGHGVARSVDGRVVEVAANIAAAEEAEAAVAAGADGIGLLRTELMVQDLAAAPSEAWLLERFARIAAALAGRTVLVRTYDIGADKPVPFLPAAREGNPFLGLRGLRLCLAHPEVFRTLIRSILRAMREHGLRAKIMLPMVTFPAELAQAKAMIRAEAEALATPCPPVGIMVEVPSTLFRMDAFAREADFFSIGTNDLAQYLLAIDRQHPRLAAQADPLDPAVLRAIASAVEAARRNGRFVGVCGNLAADPVGAALLVGLGVDELSVGVPAVAATKALVRDLSFRDAEGRARRALDLATAAEVRALFAP